MSHAIEEEAVRLLVDAMGRFGKKHSPEAGAVAWLRAALLTAGVGAALAGVSREDFLALAAMAFDSSRPPPKLSLVKEEP